MQGRDLKSIINTNKNQVQMLNPCSDNSSEIMAIFVSDIVMVVGGKRYNRFNFDDRSL